MMGQQTQGGRKLVLAEFRHFSRIYDNPLLQRSFYGRIQKKLLAAVGDQAPESVLDVGCGTGEFFFRLARKWPRAKLYGVDLSPEMLRLAQAKDYGAADVRLCEGSVYELPFETGSFDLVTSSISSHFYVDLDRALSEIRRVLRPGGRLLMASLTNGFLGFLPPPWGDELGGERARYRSPRLQKKILEDNGLPVEEAGRAVWPAWIYICRKP